MKGKILLEMIKEAFEDGNLKETIETIETIEMIDWDVKFSDNNGLNKMYVDGNNDYILRMGWNGNITFTALVYDDAVDCVREYTTHIGCVQQAAIAG